MESAYKRPYKKDAEDPYWHEATLQDYWRWSAGVPGYTDQDLLLTDEQLETAGLLKRIDGKLWHVAFMPEESCIQTKGLKEIVLARIGRAKEFEDLRAEGRALFNGVRATGFMKTFKDAWLSMNLVPDSHNPLHIAANISEFKRVHIPGVTFGEQANFYGTRFGSRAIFNNVTFQGAASFASAQFGANTFFHQAQFQKRASFEKSQFSNDTHFTQCKFADSSKFLDAIFGNDANFQDTTFTGEVDFYRTRFSDNTKFIKTHFMDKANFRNATFTGDAHFFSATFTGSANFDSATFTGDADFRIAAFTGNAYFISATFTGNAHFRNVQFEKQAIFENASFIQEASWFTAEFKQYASFANSNWGFGPYSWRFGYYGPWTPGYNDVVHYGGAFLATRFRDTANFRTDHFYAFSAFDGVTLDKVLLLKEPAEASAPDDRFGEACEAVKHQIEKDKAAAHEREDDTRTPERIAREEGVKRWSELSGGYLAVKAAMERAGDFDRAQRYHKYEVQARVNRPSTGNWEKAAAWVYSRASDYGASLWRPLVALLILWVSFSALYLLLAWSAGTLEVSLRFGAPIAPDVRDAFGLSFKNALLNIDSFGGNAQTNLKTIARLFGDNGLISGAARFLGAFQTFLSLILAFLFGLAVRRKFQIR